MKKIMNASIKILLIPLISLLFSCAHVTLETTDGQVICGQDVCIEISKPMKPSFLLRTMKYQPTSKEDAFLKKVTEKEIDLWNAYKMTKPSNVNDDKWQKMQEEAIPMERYHLIDQVGEFVGWFGIVRKVIWGDQIGTTSLLLEHKYFDGLTDVHIQIVSLNGAGDFKAMIPPKIKGIPLLSLVRVYGRVSKGEDGLPTLTAEYIRLWDWGLFSFMFYGEDRTNPEWLKLRQIKGRDAYNPRPTKKFYEKILGKRE